MYLICIVFCHIVKLDRAILKASYFMEKDFIVKCPLRGSDIIVLLCLTISC